MVDPVLKIEKDWQKILIHHGHGQGRSRSFIGTDTDRLATYDLVFCGKHGPIKSVSEINGDFC